MDQIQINLIAREDRYGKKYYIANPTLKLNINLTDMVFFVFTAEGGEESLVIRTRQPREDRSFNKEDDKENDIPVVEKENGNNK